MHVLHAGCIVKPRLLLLLEWCTLVTGRAGLVQECDRLGDFQGVRDFLEFKSPGSSRTGALAMALINSEQELAREHTRSGHTRLRLARRI